MGKKKKATNSARGFATTSTPSKAKNVTPSELIDKENPKKAKIGSENTSTKIVTDSTEDIESQRYIEKLRDLNSIKVEAYFEETEKIKNRVDKLPVLKLDANIEQAVIKHIKKIGYQEQVNDKIDSKVDREQVLVKLDIIYLILKRLGFLKRDVETCIRKICSLEVQSALDWLCINVSSESLPIGFADKLYHEDETDITFVRTSSSLQTPVGKTEPLTQNVQTQNQNVSTQNEKTNLPNRDVLRSTKSTKSAMLDEKLKSLTLNALENINSDSEEENDPNMKYAILKYELMGKSAILKKLEKSKNNKNNNTKCDLILNQINKLNSQIKLIEQDYLFRKKIADNIYNKKIKNSDFKEFDIDSDDEEEEGIEKKEDKDAIDDHENFLGFSIKDEEDGDLFGGLLDIPISTTDDNNNINLVEVETTDKANNTSCTLRDMPVPPSWTGKLPKDILQEFCRKIDSKVLVTFSKEPTIGGNSIMKAKVNISWSNGKSDAFIMKDEGCRTFEEAKNYVSTLALFELTNLPLYMAFPPSYSDLWKELIQAKNIAANKNMIATEEERMKFLLSVVDNKVKEVMKIQEVTKNDTISQESNMMPTKIVPISKDTKISDEGKAIKKAFENRQTSKPYKDLLNVRKQLPMYSYREELLKELNQNQVVIVSGETGCGKSTQVPQFIAEHMIMNEVGDHCNILCTQPRRISAISIAHRVSLEMGDAPGTTGSTKSLVGYQIRLESRISRSNVMTFCTNGILLRRLEGDGLLNGVSHIIVDEVHERTLEIDFLLIILKNLLQKRHDLNGCPLVEVPGRTFPVAIKYLEDVIEETEYMINEGDEYARKVYRKIKDEGTITIGRGDSLQKLNYELEEDRDMNDDFEFPDEELFSSYSQRTRSVLRRIDHEKINYDLILSLLRYICISKDDKSLNTDIPPDGAILVFLPGMPEIIKLYDLLMCDRHFEDETRFLVFPLHSLISSENQGRVFEIPPKGVRKIVLATNIAETGITISDVTVVIDTGKVNLVRYNKQKRITTLEETFVAKANARQRRGRAGRIREGICFHLFTKWKHDYNMLDYEPPEILRLPLQELCLKIKICGMGDINDVLTMAIDPPTPQAIEDAISSLQEVTI
ncbi:1245_t:CDS:10 [Diversispora eburnea]|uniref:RNA helicase n=1 Tax=Diversispora eburnea TaxID=1213867 RepID=A0A9N9FXF5_9GLOM|nr:1245_t:CDS:10 [Diversispora eburnea]